MTKKSRLIDANLLEEAVRDSKNYNPHMTAVARQNHMYEHDHFLKLIAAAPTVDAAEVAHGQWLGEGDGYSDGRLVYDVWFCSECNFCIDYGIDDPELLPKYCENCGAKMDKEVSNANRDD